MINLSNIYIPTEFVNKIVLELSLISILVYLMFSLINNKECSYADFKDNLIIFIKASAYITFSYIVYISYKKQNSMDIITVFSFMFSSLEAAHNIGIFVGEFLIASLKCIFEESLIGFAIIIIIILSLGKGAINNYPRFEESTEKWLTKAVLVHKKDSESDEFNNIISDKSKINYIARQYATRRQELGKSNKEIANRTGIEERDLEKYENGNFNKVDIRDLNMIADALETTPGYLLGWTK